MKNIKQRLMLSCQEAAGLIEKKMHFKLSVTESVTLTLHKMACNACRMYEKQNKIMDNKLKEIGDIRISHTENPDTKELERKILLKLSEQKNPKM